MVDVFTMIMFPIETGEAGSLRQQQRITPHAQTPDKSLTPWYPYDKSSHCIFIKCVKFFLMFDMWGTSHLVMELVLGNGLRN